MPSPTPSVNALTVNAATANLIDSFNVPSGISIVGQAGGTFDFRLGNGYLAMTAVGDTLYGGTGGIATALAGNTTGTKKFLSQTGAGGISAAPAWSTVTNSDVGSEPALGNPASSGYLLSSTTLGVRSWIAAPATGVTSVASGTGLTGGPITSTGTLSVTGPLLTLANLADAAGWLHSTGTNVFAWSTPSKTDVGLGNVTNDAQAKAGAVGSSGLTMSTARLLGRATAATGAIEEISLGTNLSFSGTTLNAAGGSTSFANPTANVSNSAVNGSASTAMRSDAAPAIATSAALQLATLGLGTAISSGHILDVQAVNAVAAGFGDLVGSGALFYFNVPTGLVNLYSRNNHAISFSGYSSGAVEWARFTTTSNLLIGTTSETGLTGGGGLKLNSSTDSSSTGTGAFICPGGAGIAKTLYVGTKARIVGTNDSVVVSQASSTGYAGIRIYNDQASNVRSLEIDYAGSSYATAVWNGGTTGEAGALGTTGNYPLFIGTNNNVRIIITGAGVVSHLDATDATTTATGSLQLAGGLGVVKTIWANALHLPSSGFAMRDTSAAYDLTIASTSSTAFTAGRTLTIDLVNAARTLKIQGSPTLDDWFDQNVKTTASPTFVGLNLSAKLTVTGANVRLSNAYFLSGNLAAGTEVTLIGRNVANQVSIDPDGYNAIFGGNVGIGTTTPGATLEVNGNIKTGAPAGGTAGAWKFGIYVAGIQVSNGYVQLDIGGTLYKLLAST